MLILDKVSFDVGDAKKEILRNVSLTIPDIGFTVITGPNGSGKSSLAKIIMGIEQPTSGKIYYNEQDITGLSVTERAKLGISFAFQQPVRFKGLTVHELICLAAGKELGIKESCKYLSKVGLCAQDYIDRELDSSLSGGEIKRIEIALVMARDSKLAVFDEPEAGIDLWSFSRLVGIFEEMRSESRTSVVIISHQERILAIADQLVLIVDGQISKTAGSLDEMGDLFTTGTCCRDFRTEMRMAKK